MSDDKEKEVKIDDDLIDLLGDDEPVVEDIVEEDVIEEEVPSATQPVVEPQLNAPIPTETKPLPASNLLDSDAAEAEDNLGFKKLLATFGESVNLILKNQKSDRDQVEEVILYFRNVVDSARLNNQKLPPAFIEALPKLLQTKTDINTNATKLLDSIAKLLSAGKKNDLIINLTGGVQQGSIDIKSLLSQGTREDEDILGDK